MCLCCKQTKSFSFCFNTKHPNAESIVTSGSYLALAVGESNFATYKLILMSKNLNFTSGFSGNIIMLRRSGAVVGAYATLC